VTVRAISNAGRSYFVFTGGEGRVRRPRDVATAVIGLLLIGWGIAAADHAPEWSNNLAEMVSMGPEWVYGLLAMGYLVSLIYALVVTFALFFGKRRGQGALRDLLVVGVATITVVVILSLLVNGAMPYILPEIDLSNAPPRFPVTRVSLVTAILLVTAPYLTRPLRRFGRWAILVTAAAAVCLGYGSPIHVIASFGVGMFVAGLWLVIAGTPRGYPAPDAVAEGLARLGVPNQDIAPVAEQEWGLVRFTATDESGSPLDIKVHGRDSFDSQLAAKAWRTLIYREIGRTVSFSRLQAVEHEALVTMMAERAGVSVPALRAVGTASAELALVAFSGQGDPLDGVGDDLVTDDLLVRTWEMVGRLHDANISHGSLSTGAIKVDRGEPLLVNLALGSLAPEEDDRAGDIVELLFSTALRVGADRAATTAALGLGMETLAGVLPYLQVPAVSAPTRRKAESPRKVVTALVTAIVDITGVEKPKPVELRRVTLKSLVMVGLLLLIAYALIPMLTRVDYDEIWAVLEAANWPLIILALIVGQSQFLPQATATMFAVPAKLPFWPLVVLQTASQFLSLAVPSSAGRVAMNAAFLHKFGVSVTVAVAQGAIDGFSGFLVQAAIMLIVLLTGDVDLGLNIDTSEVPWLVILVVLLVVVALVVLLFLRVRKLREKVAPILRQAWGALLGVLKEPARAFGLLGSNFVFWNLLGLTIWILLAAVGSPIDYGLALFVATGTSLLAGIMPVPGGVGVAEATMVSLLVTFGVDDSVAFAVTACYRIITFYLPALQGFFGARWLEKNDYI
jgi:uncharacterized protein (TIRG00374 family)